MKLYYKHDPIPKVDEEIEEKPVVIKPVKKESWEKWNPEHLNDLEWLELKAMVRNGYTDEQIADWFGISLKTVSIYKKL